MADKPIPKPTLDMPVGESGPRSVPPKNDIYDALDSITDMARKRTDEEEGAYTVGWNLAELGHTDMLDVFMDQPVLRQASGGLCHDHPRNFYIIGANKMSRTYNLCCTECSKRIWIGQTDADQPGFRLYHGGDHTEALTLFLAKHEGHELRVVEDNELEMINFEIGEAEAEDTVETLRLSI